MSAPASPVLGLAQPVYPFLNDFSSLLGALAASRTQPLQQQTQQPLQQQQQQQPQLQPPTIFVNDLSCVQPAVADPVPIDLEMMRFPSPVMDPLELQARLQIMSAAGDATLMSPPGSPGFAAAANSAGSVIASNLAPPLSAQPPQSLHPHLQSAFVYNPSSSSSSSSSSLSCPSSPAAAPNTMHISGQTLPLAVHHQRAPAGPFLPSQMALLEQLLLPLAQGARAVPSQTGIPGSSSGIGTSSGRTSVSINVSGQLPSSRQPLSAHLPTPETSFPGSLSASFASSPTSPVVDSANSRSPLVLPSALVSALVTQLDASSLAGADASSNDDGQVENAVAATADGSATEVAARETETTDKLAVPFSASSTPPSLSLQSSSSSSSEASTPPSAPPKKTKGAPQHAAQRTEPPRKAAVATAASTSTAKPSASSTSAKSSYRFPCGLCDRAFTRKYNLEAHVRSHNNIKPFKCPACPDAFVRKHDLQRHMAGLHERRFWACALCPRKYARSDSYRKHMRDEHPDALPAASSVMAGDGMLLAAPEVEAATGGAGGRRGGGDAAAAAGDDDDDDGDGDGDTPRVDAEEADVGHMDGAESVAAQTHGAASEADPMVVG